MKTICVILLLLSINFFFSDNSLSFPVELTSFTASVKTNNVALQWQTVFESNNSGFFVERKSADSSNWTQLGFVNGNGTTNNPHTYNYNDNGLAIGNYNYRLKQVDFNNAFQYFDLSSVVIIMTISISNNNSVIADNFILYQNFPNPFNPETVINYVIPAETHHKVSVQLIIYDVLGNEVVTLVNQKQNGGEHSVTFNARLYGQATGLSSGIYLYKLKVNEFEQVKRMMLVK
ncbi:MAG: T9SS type A sorting domain-containing protein [Bacteroidota bacterium]|nr:T9SS type A sorting domain-containing protein [Bacteroidota bacterium]